MTTDCFELCVKKIMYFMDILKTTEAGPKAFLHVCIHPFCNFIFS